MRRVLGTIAILSVSATFADAASLTNKDGGSQTIVITEKGVRSEFAIAAGETVTTCESGCFLTLPNGDRAALSGTETVSIVNGGIVME